MSFSYISSIWNEYSLQFPIYKSISIIKKDAALSSRHRAAFFFSQDFIKNCSILDAAKEENKNRNKDVHDLCK